MTQNIYKGSSKKNHKFKTNKNKKTTIRTKKRGLQGGFKIGEGGFGCVVVPHIPCSKKDLKQGSYVSKIIQSNLNDYKEEILILNKIKSIDPENEYLISYVETCRLYESDVKNRKSDKDIIKIKYDNLSNKKSTEKFTILDKDIKNNIKKGKIEDEYCKFDPRLQYFNQIQIKGGDELYHYLKLNNKSIQYKLFKNQCSSIFKYLLTGLKLLHKNKVVHRDIKPHNILIKLNDKNNLIPKYIDFGLSTDFNEEYQIEDIGHRQGTATYIPIDIYIAYRIIKLEYKTGNVFTLNSINKLKTEINKIYISKYKPSYEKDKLNKSFLKFKSTNSNSLTNTKEYVDSQDIYKLLIKLLIQHRKGKLLSNHKRVYDGYMYKADIFALGLTFKKYYDAFNINNNKIENLIKHMLLPNPDKRYNVNQCLKHISIR